MVHEHDDSGEDGRADPPDDAAEVAQPAPDATDQTDSSDASGQPSPADDRATQARILRLLAGGMDLVGRVL